MLRQVYLVATLILLTVSVALSVVFVLSILDGKELVFSYVALAMALACAWSNTKDLLYILKHKRRRL